MFLIKFLKVVFTTGQVVISVWFDSVGCDQKLQRYQENLETVL